MALPRSRDLLEVSLNPGTRKRGDTPKTDFDEVVGQPLPHLKDAGANHNVSSADDSLDDHGNIKNHSYIPSEEDDTEEDPDQIDFPPSADRPPQKKPRVSMSQSKARERPSSNEIKIPSLGIPCEDRCAKKCTLNISHERRKTIFNAYWSMSRHEQRLWVFGRVSRDLKHRDTTSPGHISRRSMTYSYHLKADDCTSYEVCKTFFLTTLGYHPKNDRFIMTALRATSLESVVSSTDRRGKHVPSNKLDTHPIKAHIESFGPSICHYRCKHDPKMRYLPSTITIRFMYQDFIDKNPGTKCSYETYRKVVRELKISFTKLGEEECGKCSEIEIHTKAKDHEQSIQSQKGSGEQNIDETAADEVGDRRTAGTADVGSDMEKQARAADVVTGSNEPVGPGSSTHNEQVTMETEGNE